MTKFNFFVGSFLFIYLLLEKSMLQKTGKLSGIDLFVDTHAMGIGRAELWGVGGGQVAQNPPPPNPPDTPLHRGSLLCYVSRFPTNFLKKYCHINFQIFTHVG